MKENKQSFLLELFPQRIRVHLEHIDWKMEQLEEIRIRTNQPLVFLYGDSICYVCADAKGFTQNVLRAISIREDEVRVMLDYMCSYSLYAYARDLQMGFLTLKGGFRVGVLGEVVEEQGKVLLMENARFFNIRIAKQMLDCAKEIYPLLWNRQQFMNTLLISSPGVGKTTYLRDIIRLLASDEERQKKVVVVDERYEIAAAVAGVPQNDLGMYADVISGCSKNIAMEMALRTMSPDVIAVDELGGEDDYRSVQKCAYSGVNLIATVHGNTIEDVENQVWGHKWIQNHIFHKYIVIYREEGKRKIKIYDEDKGRCY